MISFSDEFVSILCLVVILVGILPILIYSGKRN